ncbi:unnamed protein product, partial [Closterium sp. Naga37s-1]
MPPALNRSSSAAAAAANAKMYSAQGPHVVGLDEIEALKASANNLFVEGKFGQAIIGECRARPSSVSAAAGHHR